MKTNQTIILELLKIVNLQREALNELTMYNEQLNMHLDDIERLYLKENNKV